MMATGTGQRGRSIVAGTLVVLGAWQVILGSRDIVANVTSNPWTDRRFSVMASERERIARAVGPWVPIWDAIDAHVQDDGVVAFVGGMDEQSFGPFWLVTVLVYPRRTIAMADAMAGDLQAATVREVVARRRPAFVVDRRSGMRLPPGAQRVVVHADFTLWRLPL